MIHYVPDTRGAVVRARFRYGTSNYLKLSRESFVQLTCAHLIHMHVDEVGRSLRDDRYAFGISLDMFKYHVEIFDWRRSSSKIHRTSLFTPDRVPVSDPVTYLPFLQPMLLGGQPTNQQRQLSLCILLGFTDVDVAKGKIMSVILENRFSCVPLTVTTDNSKQSQRMTQE